MSHPHRTGNLGGGRRTEAHGMQGSDLPRRAHTEIWSGRPSALRRFEWIRDEHEDGAAAT